jgi:hypothetical protein
MKIRVRLSAALMTCKRCGDEHNNPFTHACVVPFSALASRRPGRKNRR